MIRPLWVLLAQFLFIISEELNPFRGSTYLGFGRVFLDFFRSSFRGDSNILSEMGIEVKIFLRHNDNHPFLFRMLRREQLSPGIVIKRRSLRWRRVSLLRIIQIPSIARGLTSLKESFFFLLYWLPDHSCDLKPRCTSMKGHKLSSLLSCKFNLIEG